MHVRLALAPRIDREADTYFAIPLHLHDDHIYNAPPLHKGCGAGREGEGGCIMEDEIGWLRRRLENDSLIQCDVMCLVEKTERTTPITINRFESELLLSHCVYDRGSVSLRQAALSALNIYKNTANDTLNLAASSSPFTLNGSAWRGRMLFRATTAVDALCTPLLTHLKTLTFQQDQSSSSHTPTPTSMLYISEESVLHYIQKQIQYVAQAGRGIQLLAALLFTPKINKRATFSKSTESLIQYIDIIQPHIITTAVGAAIAILQSSLPSHELVNKYETNTLATKSVKSVNITKACLYLQEQSSLHLPFCILGFLGDVSDYIMHTLRGQLWLDGYSASTKIPYTAVMSTIEVLDLAISVYDAIVSVLTGEARLACMPQRISTQLLSITRNLDAHVRDVVTKLKGIPEVNIYFTDIYVLSSDQPMLWREWQVYMSRRLNEVTGNSSILTPDTVYIERTVLRPMYYDITHPDKVAPNTLSIPTDSLTHLTYRGLVRYFLIVHLRGPDAQREEELSQDLFVPKLNESINTDLRALTERWVGRDECFVIDYTNACLDLVKNIAVSSDPTVSYCRQASVDLDPARPDPQAIVAMEDPPEVHIQVLLHDMILPLVTRSVLMKTSPCVDLNYARCTIILLVMKQCESVLNLQETDSAKRAMLTNLLYTLLYLLLPREEWNCCSPSDPIHNIHQDLVICFLLKHPPSVAFFERLVLYISDLYHHQRSEGSSGSFREGKVYPVTLLLLQILLRKRDLSGLSMYMNMNIYLSGFLVAAQQADAIADRNIAEVRRFNPIFINAGDQTSPLLNWTSVPAPLLHLVPAIINLTAAMVTALDTSHRTGELTGEYLGRVRSDRLIVKWRSKGYYDQHHHEVSHLRAEERPYYPSEDLFQAALTLLSDALFLAGEGGGDDKCMTVVKAVINTQYRIEGKATLLTRVLMSYLEGSRSSILVEKMIAHLYRRPLRVTPDVDGPPSWSLALMRRDPLMLEATCRYITGEAGPPVVSDMEGDIALFNRLIVVLWENLLSSHQSMGALYQQWVDCTGDEVELDSMQRQIDACGGHISDLLKCIADLCHHLPPHLAHVLVHAILIDRPIFPCQWIDEPVAYVPLLDFILITYLLPSPHQFTNHHTGTSFTVPAKAKISGAYLLLSLCSLTLEEPGTSQLTPTAVRSKPTYSYRKQVLEKLIYTFELVDRLIVTRIDLTDYCLTCILSLSDTITSLSYSKDLVDEEVFYPRHDECIAALCVLDLPKYILHFFHYATTHIHGRLAREAICRLSTICDFIWWVGLPLCVAVSEKGKYLRDLSYCTASAIVNKATLKPLLLSSAAWDGFVVRQEGICYELQLIEWWSIFDIPKLVQAAQSLSLLPSPDSYDFAASWELPGWSPTSARDRFMTPCYGASSKASANFGAIAKRFGMTPGRRSWRDGSNGSSSHGDSDSHSTGDDSPDSLPGLIRIIPDSSSVPPTDTDPLVNQFEYKNAHYIVTGDRTAHIVFTKVDPDESSAIIDLTGDDECGASHRSEPDRDELMAVYSSICDERASAQEASASKPAPVRHQRSEEDSDSWSESYKISAQKSTTVAPPLSSTSEVVLKGSGDEEVKIDVSTGVAGDHEEDEEEWEDMDSEGSSDVDGVDDTLPALALGSDDEDEKQSMRLKKAKVGSENSRHQAQLKPSVYSSGSEPSSCDESEVSVECESLETDVDMMAEGDEDDEDDDSDDENGSDDDDGDEVDDSQGETEPNEYDEGEEEDGTDEDFDANETDADSISDKSHAQLEKMPTYLSTEKVYSTRYFEPYTRFVPYLHVSFEAECLMRRGSLSHIIETNPLRHTFNTLTSKLRGSVCERLPIHPLLAVPRVPEPGKGPSRESTTHVDIYQWQQEQAGAYLSQKAWCSDFELLLRSKHQCVNEGLKQLFNKVEEAVSEVHKPKVPLSPPAPSLVKSTEEGEADARDIPTLLKLKALNQKAMKAAAAPTLTDPDAMVVDSTTDLTTPAISYTPVSDTAKAMIRDILGYFISANTHRHEPVETIYTSLERTEIRNNDILDSLKSTAERSDPDLCPELTIRETLSHLYGVFLHPCQSTDDGIFLLRCLTALLAGDRHLLACLLSCSDLGAIESIQCYSLTNLGTLTESITDILGEFNPHKTADKTPVESILKPYEIDPVVPRPLFCVYNDEEEVTKHSSEHSLFNKLFSLSAVLIDSKCSVDMLELYLRFLIRICYRLLTDERQYLCIYDEDEALPPFVIPENHPELCIPSVKGHIAPLWTLYLGPLWSEVRVQSKVVRILTFLSHKYDHWEENLNAFVNLTPELVSNLQSDVSLMSEYLCDLSAVLRGLLIDGSALADGTLYRAKRAILTRLNELTCPQSAYKLLLAIKLITSLTDKVTSTYALAHISSTHADYPTHLLDDLTQWESPEAFEEHCRRSLREQLVTVARSSAWATMHQCVDRIRQLYAELYDSATVTYEYDITSPMTSPAPVRVTKSDSALKGASRQSVGESPGSTSSPAVLALSVPRESTDSKGPVAGGGDDGASDRLLLPLMHLSPLLECYFAVFSTCLVRPADALEGLPTANNNNMTNYGGEASPKPSHPSLQEAVPTPAALERVFSIPGSRFMATPTTQATPHRRMRLDLDLIDRHLLTDRDRDRLLAVSTPHGAASPKPTLTATPLTQLLKFIEDNAIAINRMLSQNIRLLETSLAILLVIPECKKQLSFGLKKAYFDLKIRRLKRETHYEDEDDDESNLIDITNYYITLHRRITRRTSSREFIDRDLDLPLEIERDNILESSYNELSNYSAGELLVGRFDVTFVDEEGVDGGGLTREWLALLTREIFKPQYALFVRSTEGGLAFQPNPQSNANTTHLEYFKLIGRLVGKAIVDGLLLDVHFTRPFYKHMLGVPVSFQDLKEVDEEFHKVV